MTAREIGALVKGLAEAARAEGRNSAETSLPDGTRIEIILRQVPQGPLARLLAAVEGQKPGRN